MNIVVNGEERDVPQDTTLDAALSAVGVPDRGVAVAVNGSVVRRASWPDVVLSDGADVEIVTAVQGG